MIIAKFWFLSFVNFDRSSGEETVLNITSFDFERF